MADHAQIPRGFSLTEAVWRLLNLKGAGGSFQAFLEAYPLDECLEALVRPLAEVGIQARVALVELDEVCFLQTPTALQLQDGSWALLQSGERNRFRIETPAGLAILSRGQLAQLFGGRALDLAPALPEADTLWARIKLLLGRQRSILVQVALVTLALQLLALAMPGITGVVMNRALPDGAESMLKLAGAGVLLVAAGQAWTGWVREQALLFLATRLEMTVERGFLEHLLRLPFPVLQQRTLGELLQAFGGLTTARELLAERALGALLDGALAVIYLGVMVFMMPAPTLVVLMLALAMAGLAVTTARAQAGTQALEVAAQAAQRGYLTELIAGVATVKAAGVEGQGLRRWLERFQKEMGHNLAKNRRGLYSEVGLPALQQVLTVTLLIWGGHLALKGELRIGTLFAFLQLGSGFLGAVFGVVNAYALLVLLRPQLERTQEILAAAPERRPLPAGDHGQGGQAALVMEDVWFRYSPEGPWVLQGYDLRVEPGEIHTISGPSGCGKSTVLRLLAGLYSPDQGRISLGGTEPSAVRHKILYLPQAVQLYGGTMMENLRILSGNASKERILEACSATGLDRLIRELPMGLMSVLPNGGGSLSGGQRQLIAFTAAIASTKPCLLMDEPMANLDGPQGRKLSAALREVRKTTCIASH